MTGELVHDPWAAYLTGQHNFLQPGSSLGRRTLAPSSRARRDPVKRNTDILHDSFKGDKYLAIKTNSWKAWLRNSTYNTAGGFRLVNGPPT